MTPQSDTFLCPRCFIRLPNAQRAEHLEAAHGVCGTTGCERKLDGGRCPRCDANVGGEG